jgi:hypothetical protein
MDYEVERFNQLCGSIRRTIENKTQKDEQKCYKLMVVTIGPYGNEARIVTTSDRSRHQAVEMRYLTWQVR